ncbi:short spindle 6 [Leptinotarsa decemlineata]|uniref:short spindle 6 n=1 Tax=Leptinotarsa decemlineata TaxID=7539 RepID=UPI003D3069AE
MRRNPQSQSQLQIEQDNDCTSSSPSQILERVQSDRVTVTKPEEDRRRRTIIVEKKNGSFGFTLQSYGIHYKKEKEIEMITYVDYVDYDGPAYRAGMREGDVILSINGTDMEKADHKTLVNYIKNCDTRMRMVVLFEDCVRKVELHMRYIKLQRILQTKMEELERLCLRERQLFEGKWKTHSLPARKKASQANNGGPPTPTQSSYSYCRPTVSTEDVAKVAQQQKQPTPPLVFSYQYLDSQYRYMLHPSTSSSGEYLLTFEPPRYKEQQNFIVKTPCDQRQSRGNQTHIAGSMEKAKKPPALCQSYAGQLCNPCVQSGSSNGDNTSLDAYDLASSCCDPRCVPSNRRRSRSHKDHRKRDSKTEETQTDPPQTRSRPHSQSSQTTANTQSFSAPRRYFHIGAGLVSQCSLHSCTSSEISNVVPTTVAESSANSYTTSLSTDTLYWDGSCDTSRQLSVKSNKHGDHQRYSQQPQQQETIYVQYNQVNKPKSWDNLTTKAFGGYGFGYGYLDTSSKCAQKSSRPHTKAQGTQYIRVDKQTGGNCPGQPQYTPHTHRRYFQPTKSTESLLSVPKYSSEALSDPSLSCECLEPVSPGPDTTESRFFQSPRQNVISPTDPNFGYYSARRNSKNEYPKNVSTSSEATRL